MDTHYETVYEVEEQKSASAHIRPIRSEQRPLLSRLWASVHLFLGSLWLVPIVVLLWLNLSSFRIGPSASCLGGCKADPLATDNGKWAVGLDRNDHNTLGGLQLVAKALELWFLFVAISLVYKIAMLLASRDGGLPIGLLTSPVEFADPRALFEIFRAVLRSPGQHRLRERTLPKLCLHLFVIFVVFMCVLVNLMGPAVAVLVLPTLQWVNLPKNAQHSFNASAIAKLPDGIVPGEEDRQIFPNCSSADLDSRFYSCTFIPYAASLDSWDDEVIATDSNRIGYYNTAQTAGISPEGDVFFTINATNSSADVVWAPNRQILREISEDLNNFHDASQDLSQYPAYRAYNSSLTTVLKRKGPVFGAFGNAYIPVNTTRIFVGDQQEVRCYGGYMSPSLEDGDYNKCVRIGTGWNHLNKHAGFQVGASLDSSSELANVTAYFSDTSAYYSETFNSGLVSPSCLSNATVSPGDNCDWTRFFSSDMPDNSSDTSTSILGIELSMPREFPEQKIVFEFFIFRGFSTYSLDTSPQSNPMYLVQLDDVLDISSVPVDPDWFLAAWSADQDGFIANRSASFSLIRGLKATFGPYSFANATLDDTGDNDYLNSTSSSLPSSTPVSPLSNTLALSTAVTSISSKATSFVSSATHLSVSTTAPTAVTTSGPTSGGTGQESRIKRQEATPETVEESPDLDEFSYENSDNDDDKVSDDLVYFVFYSQLQALSMVTFSKSNLTRNNTDTKDPQHPTLWYYARVHVWAYGTDSRTSKLGIAVTILGGVCVLVSTVLGIFSPRRQRSLTELLLAAIEHRYSGELDHAAGDDNLKARTRYRLHEDGHDEVIQYRPI